MNDWLGKHGEQGRADEANTGQVWGKQGRANESKCTAGVEDYMKTQGKHRATETQEIQHPKSQPSITQTIPELHKFNTQHYKLTNNASKPTTQVVSKTI